MEIVADVRGVLQPDMKLFANLRELDRQAIEERGIPGLLLMEAAGQAVADAVIELLAERGVPLHSARVTILCGPGNNGGDGYVCARHLAQRGVPIVDVLPIVAKDVLPDDARKNYELAATYRQQIDIFGETYYLAENPAHRSIRKTLLSADVVVDALFGSGLNRPLTGPIEDLIDVLNFIHCPPVVAVDIPSGIDAATGKILGIAVNATTTVTFAAGKPGLYLSPGRELAGRVKVVDIGLPKDLIDAAPTPYRLTTEAQARRWLPWRPRDGHKNTFGHVLVVAGSRGMPGAAALVARAAQMSGAGLVTLASPESAFGRVALPPELLQAPIPEAESGCFGPESLNAVTALFDQRKYHSVVLGPGLGGAAATGAFLEGFLGWLKQHCDLPTVLDADALNHLARLSTETPFPLPRTTLLTPHVGEAVRLAEADAPKEDLPALAMALSQRYRTRVALKSATTVSAVFPGDFSENEPEGPTVWLNPTGNDGMATGGSGDVLAGLLAGLLAQGMPVGRATPFGVYLHGLAGDFAARRRSRWCLVASDILDALPEAFLHLENTLPNPARKMPQP